jgi:hypothetical protein
VRYTVSANIEGLVHALRALSHEIEPQIQLVSQAARDEWRALQAVWPSDEELREGTTALTEGELQAIEVKVRRFREIVKSLASARGNASSEGSQRFAARGNDRTSPRSWA